MTRPFEPTIGAMSRAVKVSFAGLAAGPRSWLMRTRSSAPLIDATVLFSRSTAEYATRGGGACVDVLAQPATKRRAARPVRRRCMGGLLQFGVLQRSLRKQRAHLAS